MRADPLFRDVTSDSQLRGLQASLRIDRDRANTLGVSIDTLRSALYSAFGERQVSTIYTSVDSYQVILEVAPAPSRTRARSTASTCARAMGRWCRCRAFTTVDRTIGPTAINHVGQLQAVTVSFNLAPGAALGDATAKIERTASRSSCPRPSSPPMAAMRRCSRVRRAANLHRARRAVRELHPPDHDPVDAAVGRRRRAAGADAVRHDLSVIGIIGIILLIGIVKKNAIMMIDFALDAERAQGMSPREAIRRPACCASGRS
jgi:HAE1 family hydrophobic/amphiphilic exporter-1